MAHCKHPDFKKAESLYLNGDGGCCAAAHADAVDWAPDLDDAVSLEGRLLDDVVLRKRPNATRKHDRLDPLPTAGHDRVA